MALLLCTAGCYTPVDEDDVVDDTRDSTTDSRTLPEDTTASNVETGGPSDTRDRDDSGPGDANATAEGDTTTDTPSNGDTHTSPDSNLPDGGNDANTGTCTLKSPRDFGGNLTIHPATKSVDSGATLQNSKLSLLTVLDVLQSNIQPLPRNPGTGSCKDASKSFTQSAQSLNWTLDDVDVDPVSSIGGVAAIVDDAGGGSGTFVRAATHVAGPQIKNMQTAAAKNAKVFAVTDKTVDELAKISSKTRSDFMQQGIMLGQFLDQNGNPVSGVKIGEVSGSGGSKFIKKTFDDAIYPNGTFTSSTTGANGGATSSNGVFIVPDQSLTAFGGTKQSTSNSSLDTSTQSGATVADTVYSLFLTVK